MIILNQDAERWRFDIVELPGAHGPSEGKHASTSEEEGERDQDVEDGHGEVVVGPGSVATRWPELPVE